MQEIKVKFPVYFRWSWKWWGSEDDDDDDDDDVGGVKQTLKDISLLIEWINKYTSEFNANDED